MATTNETVVTLSEQDKTLLEKLSAVPPKGYANGGYTSGVSTAVHKPASERYLLEEIRDLLKEIRDRQVIETSTPAPYSPWVPYTPPYPVQPYPMWSWGVTP